MSEEHEEVIESTEDIDGFSENNSLNEELTEEPLSEDEVEHGNLELDFQQTDLWGIAGKRGSGKTNLLLFITDFLVKSGCNVLVVDPVYDLEKELKKFYGEQYAQIFNGKTSGLVHIKFQDRGGFDKLLATVFKRNWKGVMVIDEADGFFPNKVKQTDLANHFIQIGRHHGVGGIIVTRRLAKLSTDITSQANKLCMFKHWQRADLDYLRESNLGDYAELLRTLKKWHFMFLNTDEEFVQICNPVPKMK